MINKQIKKSIFNNVNLCNGFCYIHIPLIYKTSVRICSQSYADAIIYFLKIIGLHNKIYSKIKGYTVIEFLPNDINKIHSEAIAKFQDIYFFKRIKRKLDKIYEELPLLFKEMEIGFKKDKAINKKLFREIYNMLTFLISIGYFSFIIETYLPSFLINNNNEKKYSDFLSKNSFSHIKYFNSEKTKLYSLKADDIINFCWNCGFLENEIGESTKFETEKYVSKLLNKNISKKEIIPSKFDYPDIENFKEDRDIPLILLWAKLLQINLEFRHYWQFRFYRNIRFYCDNDKNVIINWTINDYEKKDFGIK